VDQHEQIVQLADYVERHFGKRPSELGLPKRVWSRNLLRLAEANVGYTVLDDIHFLSRASNRQNSSGTTSPKTKAKRFASFPGKNRWRYLIPWDTVDKVMVNLRETYVTHTDGIAAMGDDMEKFGGWPGTFDHWLSGRLARQFVRGVRTKFRLARRLQSGEYLPRTSPWGARISPPRRTPR